jgi:uncharacterized protein (TIGR00369 family)
VDPALLQLVKDGMADTVPFARHTGVVLDEISDGTAVASLPPTAEILNHVATVHAGAMFTLAETASGAAMAGALAASLFEIRPIVSTAGIEYTRPATAPLRAVATLTQPGHAVRAALAADGRVSFDADVVITDARERDVARFRATWVVKHQRAGATGR